MDIQHPIDKQIGERIRQRRLMCGFSQRDLGKKLEIHFSMYKDMKLERSEL
ncbi:MAG: hypothetical protein ACEY3F_05205 [Wolbachia sp.]